MVRFSLYLSAEVNGVTDLAPADETSYSYTFRVKCNSCREVHDNFMGMCRSDEHELPSGHGSAHLVWTCKNCQRTSTAVIESPFSPYTGEKHPQKLLTLECRGCEPVEFVPQGVWTARGVDSNTSFAEIELDEDWYDYDEKAGEEVSIVEMEWSIERK
ncbi:DUF866 domain-containing protein [Schizosaccharomyces japonicus yFS275]|uniref:DUF866 domain-containing protein n=1 Tax=Schizosaccharomyces japonicus (strain yFS275 / FY16936) TaxID=402676 RepID=B6K074_SCHJY|nr:DUF866 domain-containing protein [Schizosaccharomyces japonicus yFS275]EEB06224.1 DUF866 domain-containing protein [Schizosaccharomyces japonicus yFS275]